ncbi:MAG: NAD-binding protein [Saprospiraceae bacterium]|nr:NAD-binding protein [Saprospiraceae bacterium]MCB9345244.1 NAD-binding protein [Lewinellaceae bacterium]
MSFILNIFRLVVWFFWLPEINYVDKERSEHVFSAIRRLRAAVGLLAIAVMIGTIGYRVIEHIPWFDAYYMSLVTLSTVGFGEVIPLSHTGRVFTSFLILFNIGFFAYAISSITSIFADNDIHDFFSEYNMFDRIQHLNNHTIVCGYGRHSIEVCEELTKEKVPFLVIELSPERIEFLKQETDYIVLEGDATDDSTLLEAGIEKASALVVTLPKDASNLFVVLSARQLNPKLKIISRLNNAADEPKLLRAGANHVVMPERIGGFYMAMLVNNSDLGEFFSLISNIGANRVVFEEIPVGRLKEKFRGENVKVGDIQEAVKIPILALRKKNGQYELNPGPLEPVGPEMNIVILGDTDQIKHFTKTALSDV